MSGTGSGSEGSDALQPVQGPSIATRFGAASASSAVTTDKPTASPSTSAKTRIFTARPSQPSQRGHRKGLPEGRVDRGRAGLDDEPRRRLIRSEDLEALRGH